LSFSASDDNLVMAPSSLLSSMGKSSAPESWRDRSMQANSDTCRSSLRVHFGQSGVVDVLMLFEKKLKRVLQWAQ
jgi:hypothetical protein